MPLPVADPELVVLADPIVLPVMRAFNVPPVAVPDENTLIACVLEAWTPLSRTRPLIRAATDCESVTPVPFPLNVPDWIRASPIVAVSAASTKTPESKLLLKVAPVIDRAVIVALPRAVTRMPCAPYVAPVLL